MLLIVGFPLLPVRSLRGLVVAGPLSGSCRGNGDACRGERILLIECIGGLLEIWPFDS